MPPSSDIVAPVGAEHNTLYVAIEISRKSWVIGIKSPASERISLHSLGAADVVGLKDLIEHQQIKAERALGREVRVLCCCSACNFDPQYQATSIAYRADRRAIHAPNNTDRRSICVLNNN